MKDNIIEMNEKDEKNLISSKNPENQRNKNNLKSSGKTLSTFSNKKLIDNFPPKKKPSLFQKSKLRQANSSKQITRHIKINSKKYSDTNVVMYSNNINSTNNLENTTVVNKTKANDEINPEKNNFIQEGKLDNYELNNLEFKQAKKLDKRSFIDMYWSTLKREQLIFFTFFVRNDYNLVFVKFSRFIFIFCTEMALNVFFYSDETMHKQFVDYGKYNFVQQIPQIVYSSLVSQLLEVFLCFLSMTDKHYYEIKHLSIKSKYEVFNIIKCVKRKITIYFVFTFLLFAFYWYSIACFCAVYVNTQIAFIKDSVTSFAFGLLYPFILYLFPAILRVISLRLTKSDLSCLYTMSDIIPFF